ncbi:uncharacterized protein [Nicotiana tomentosiformis]|uniref:uncharacterized protein n=1 Tax=Nicotiana tomentosiformis TaxID=4098 RepID=UPI00388C823E
MKSIWDELDALNTFSVCVCECECECGAKVKSLKAHQDERLMHLLMGLNGIFIGVRSNILLSSPLPSIGHVYSFVIQDEKQREIHAIPVYPWESASFIAINQSENFRKFNENMMQKTSFEFKKNARIYSYCKKPGHSIDKCYMIHGFPADFKFTRQKRFQGHSMKSPLEIGKEKRGFYILRSRHRAVVSKSSPKFRRVFIPRRNYVSNHGLHSCFSFSDSIVKEKLWYYRLGHMPLSSMKNVSSVSIS